MAKKKAGLTPVETFPIDAAKVFAKWQAKQEAEIRKREAKMPAAHREPSPSEREAFDRAIEIGRERYKRQLAESGAKTWAALDRADELAGDAHHVEERGRAASLDEVRAGRKAAGEAALLRARVADRSDPLDDFASRPPVAGPEARIAQAATLRAESEDYREIYKDSALHWKNRVHARASEWWLDQYESGTTPKKLGAANFLAGWCRENDVLTSENRYPSANYLRVHILGSKHWTPPARI